MHLHPATDFSCKYAHTRSQTDLEHSNELHGDSFYVAGSRHQLDAADSKMANLSLFGSELLRVFTQHNQTLSPHLMWAPVVVSTACSVCAMQLLWWL